MKALILAAGFGTRLAPYTETIPKALFPVAGIPVLKRMITNLKRAGFTAIAVNTHHLAEQIESFLTHNDFGVRVIVSHEPEILGTGGAIRHISDFWGDDPFLVVNADIVTDIDLVLAYRRHLSRRSRVTLVLHDRDPFNRVWVDGGDRVTGFSRFASSVDRIDQRQMAFTGIHIMDPEIIRWIPADGFSDIIEVYDRMITAGKAIHGHVVKGHYWQDMGDPERYRQTVMDAMAPEIFRSAFPDCRDAAIQIESLSGDGSDRRWFRLSTGHRRLVVADHGITPSQPGSEVNAFVNIGNHLRRCGLPVPRIHAYDGFSGLVFLEDLGNHHLQQKVRQISSHRRIEVLYQRIIDTLLDLSASAVEGFDPDWTCQSRAYDEPLILDKECRYFVDAFLNGYLGLAIPYDALASEFEHLAVKAVEESVSGLIHRDFQSRNIMIHNGQHYLIDFQGARYGPVQYDLASLLIDPYAGLDRDLQQRLLAYAASQAVERISDLSDPDGFIQGFHYCAITRNLQMLGAFGFLSRVKGKIAFEQWIPAAASMLAGHLQRADRRAFPRMTDIAKSIFVRRR